MSTDYAWGCIAPGQMAMEAETAGGGFAVLAQLGGIQPDIVTLPAELGGDTRKVVHRFMAPCPKHPLEHEDIPHYSLEGDISVAGCKGCREWIWYREDRQ